MHVIHVISEPSRGGAELLVRELNARLPTDGVQSSALYFMNPRKVSLAATEKSFDFQSPWDLRAVWKLRREVVEALKHTPNVIVHAHLTQPQYLVPLAVAGLPVTKLFTEHSSHNNRRSMPFMQPIERRNYQFFDEVICISQGTADALEFWIGPDHPTKISVALNGARLFEKLVRTPGEKMRLVSVGSLNEHKGIDIAIDAIFGIADQVEKYTLVGTGPHEAKLKDMVRKYALEGKVEFAGWHTDIKPFLAAADIFVLPSRWEGFGLVAVEALSTGMPVACSDVAGLREIVKDCSAAVLFPAEDASALAKACTDLFAKLRLGHRFDDAAANRASRFSLDIMTKKYADIYKSYAAA